MYFISKKSKSSLIMLSIITLMLILTTSCNHPARERVANPLNINQKKNRDLGDKRNEFLDRDFSILSKGFKLPEGATVLRNIPYGTDELQRMDVYLPAKEANSPVIFMVHGGAWRIGDKTSKSVVENKVSRWVSKGFIFISTNYRMLPETAPLDQAQDIVKALVYAQNKAETWGGNPRSFILVGHSAGAHLVSLVASSPEKAYAAGAIPWIETISLDSAALDVVKVMESNHYNFFDKAFGDDSNYWIETSPYHQLTDKSPILSVPYLAVCSSQRKESVEQNSLFVDKINDLGGKATILKQDLSHKEINMLLGADNEYTVNVEDFMGLNNKEIAKLLGLPEK
ncbi:MAG: alpha/beta hydrolase [Rubrobacteridae bacterium]|nr:alpha/beta hydrolase [Rubrobacteridae bacterium]